MGIIIVHTMSKIFGCDVPIYFYLIGIFLSVLPDLDVLLIMFGVIDDHHDLVTHYPIPMIVFSCFTFGLISIVQPVLYYWTAVVGLCLFFHYFDDSIGRITQLGLRWGMPFNDKYYAVFPWRVLTQEEVEKLSILHWRKWLDKYYLKVTPESAAGGILFIAAIFLAYFW